MPAAAVIRPEATPAPQYFPFVPGVQPPGRFTLVIFGPAGNLAARKGASPCSASLSLPSCSGP
jgi:hypothetical protein